MIHICSLKCNFEICDKHHEEVETRICALLFEVRSLERDLFLAELKIREANL